MSFSRDCTWHVSFLCWFIVLNFAFWILHLILHFRYKYILTTNWFYIMYTNVACAIGPSVNPFSTDFSFQNLILKNLFEFLVAKIILKSISPTFESKSYQINSIKSCSSRSFQEHQRHISIPPEFSTSI